MRRSVIAFIGLASVVAFAGCDEASEETTTTIAPVTLTAPVTLADGYAGIGIVDWDPVPGRELVVYSVDLCDVPWCGGGDRRLYAADGRGEPWELADIDEESSFEIAADGATVDAAVGGELTTISLDGPAPRLEDPAGVPGPAVDTMPGFEPFHDAVATLRDGRLIVRGASDGDEPIAGWSIPIGEAERRDRTYKPVRLFVLDPTDGTLTAISDMPESHERTTATGDYFSPDLVLWAEVLAGERLVVYELGFSGAAYDIPYSLHIAPIPPDDG